MAVMAAPNIIFILADDLGYGDIHSFGNPHIRTPHLDRLAAGGLTLGQHYAGSPLCAPSRAAFLTGRFNHRCGAVDVPSNRGLDRIHLSETTIADCLRQHGYRTGMVGKWHNGLHDPRYHPRERGFEEFYGFLGGGMDYHRWILDVNGVETSADGRYLTDVFSAAAVDFVARHQHEAFFLYLAYNAPHSPLQAPADVIDRYQQAGLPATVATIYAMIEVMDQGIGRLLDELEQRGLQDNTLIVFSSDNGPVLSGDSARYNGPYSGSKGAVHEGGIRVPSICRWPASLPQGRCHAMCTQLDWLPTVLRAAGIQDAGPYLRDGCDLLALLQGEVHEIPELRFWQRNRYTPVSHCNAAVRDGPWKLLWPMRDGADRKDMAVDQEPYLRGLTRAHWQQPVDTSLFHPELGPPVQSLLFHIDDDPGEQNDLSALHPDRVRRMQQAWERWFEEVDRQRQDAWRDNRQDLPLLT